MADSEVGPWAQALRSNDIDSIQTLLAKLVKADVGDLRVERTDGERFTGGKSTPVWKVYFTATRAEQRKVSQLVIKWVRFKDREDPRLRSYRNEREFYLRVVPTVRKSCRVPHMLHGELSATEICFVLEDVSVEYPLHPDCLSLAEAQGALRWLAHFHAQFWEADSAGGTFPVNATGYGDYWGLAKRDSEAALATIPTTLMLSSKVLKAHGVWDLAKSLGVRLVAAAHALDGNLRRPKGFVRHRTLIHGDFKTANMFLRAVEDGDSVEVAALDFEFAGPGLAAVDLAYLLFPDLRMNLLEDEATLLRCYHGFLVERLDELGSGADFPFDLLLGHYAAARCDHMRYMLGRGWTACTAGDVALVAQVEKDMRLYDGGQTLTPEAYELAVSTFFKS